MPHASACLTPGCGRATHGPQPTDFWLLAVNHGHPIRRASRNVAPGRRSPHHRPSKLAVRLRGSHRREPLPTHFARQFTTASDICGGDRLSARLSQTGLDPLSVPGGQGVAGSNPAVPTGSRIFSNVFMSYREPAKEPISLRNDLLRPCADRVPRCPTRAFATTAELRSRLVKGSKIAEPLPEQPRSPGATRRLTAAQRWMTRSSKPGIRSWSSSCAGWSTSLQGCCVGRPPGGWVEEYERH